MKKLFLTAIIALGLVACSGSPGKESPADENPPANPGKDQPVNPSEP
jgi:hypothetical protein